jgi:hypothetical protein
MNKQNSTFTTREEFLSRPADAIIAFLKNDRAMGAKIPANLKDLSDAALREFAGTYFDAEMAPYDMAKA